MEPLELQNAETKRAASKIGAHRLEFSSSGQSRVGPRIGEGPSNLITTSGYSTTVALSTMRNLLGAQTLRRGDGVISMPASRRNERLFGVTGSGRTKHLCTGVNLENIGKDYMIRVSLDTSLKAFVCLIALKESARDCCSSARTAALGISCRESEC